MTYALLPERSPDDPLNQEARRRHDLGAPFAMATVVRTLAATSARPGAKALIDTDGNIIVGFLGGGCVQSAVRRATKEAIATGAPQLLSIKPEELLSETGVTPGEARDGIVYARNGCPSKGALDIFIEPVLPRPRIMICGAGPVALALAKLAEPFEFERTLCAVDLKDGAPRVDHLIPHLGPDPLWDTAAYVVIATQGKGDLDALRRALTSKARHIGFVASHRKFETLSARLIDEGISRTELDRVKAPAGLDIHAITPEEIALSILAELVARRRALQRGGSDAD